MFLIDFRSVTEICTNASVFRVLYGQESQGNCCIAAGIFDDILDVGKPLFLEVVSVTFTALLPDDVVQWINRTERRVPDADLEGHILKY